MPEGIASETSTGTDDIPKAMQERVRSIEARPLPSNIWALLESAAQDAPEARAWCFFANEDRIGYAELAASVNRVAAGLQDLGVGASTHVAVMLPNISAMPLAWLALARLGAVMIPINTRYTGRELHYVLEDSEARYLITDLNGLSVYRSMPKALPELDKRILVTGGDSQNYLSWDALLRSPRSAPDILREPGLDSLLNIQYTSGTTGFPKGCLLTQRYWLTCAKVYAEVDGLAYRSILADNPFFYMTPQWLLLMAFFHRATLYVSPQISASRFSDIVRTYDINYCLFREAYHHRAPARPEDAHNALKRMNIYPHRADEHAAMERRYRSPVRPAFGMTEIGVGLVMPLEADGMVGSGSCGLPAPFRECRIADDRGDPVPVGTPGELLVRGSGLFQGYYRKPEATAQAFHGEWFRTGDLARCDTNGYFYIIGRIKDIIKRSGENIAAAEVEAVIASMPGVEEVAALAVPDSYRGEEVKVYVVLAAGYRAEDVSPSRIIEHCKLNLAPFKIPRYIAYRQEPLPRTASGKITKQPLLHSQPDMRMGSWDNVEGHWHQEECNKSEKA